MIVVLFSHCIVLVGELHPAEEFQMQFLICLGNHGTCKFTGLKDGPDGWTAEHAEVEQLPGQRKTVAEGSKQEFDGCMFLPESFLLMANRTFQKTGLLIGPGQSRAWCRAEPENCILDTAKFTVLWKWIGQNRAIAVIWTQAVCSMNSEWAYQPTHWFCQQVWMLTVTLYWSKTNYLI